MDPEAPLHLRLAGVIRLSLAGGRGPSDAYVFDPHRLALPCWACALGEGGAPALMVSLDRHLDVVPPRQPEAVPDQAAGLRVMDEHARWALDVRNYDKKLGVRPVNPSDPDFLRYVNEGTVKWVVTQEGELLIIPRTWRGMEIAHSVASGGRPVLAAGEAEIAIQGSTRFGTEITSHSGHYLNGASRAVNDRVVEIGRQAFARFGITFHP